MSFELNAVISLSVSLAAIMGWIRIKKIDPAFFPFILLMIAGLINETISVFIAYKQYSNAIPFNLYSLSAALLLGWQFYRWGRFKSKTIYLLVQVLFLATWLFETFVYRKNLFNSYFIIGYSFVIVLLCIEQINHEILPIKRQLWKDPIFLICMGLLIFYTYSIMVEAFWHYGLNRSKYFRQRIYEIMAYINLLTNLLFAFAVLWMPLKLRYMLRY